jgi:hypothetical protein
MILYGNWFEKHANKRTTTVLNTAHLLMGDELNSDECQDIHQCEREPEFAHVQNTSFKQCCNFGGLMIRGLSALNEERHWTEGSMSTCRLKTSGRVVAMVYDEEAWTRAEYFSVVTRYLGFCYPVTRVYPGICDAKPWCDMMWYDSIILD